MKQAEGRMFYVPFGSTFIVHPGRFVLAATLEWVRVPETLGGFITGKSTIGRRGLIIETAAGLHPCFSGCITLELANSGEVPIALVPGMRICQVFFHKLTAASPQAASRVLDRTSWTSCLKTPRNFTRGWAAIILFEFGGPFPTKRRMCRLRHMERQGAP